MTPGSLVVAFVLALRNTCALAETRDHLVRLGTELERERFARRQDHHRHETEMRFVAAELESERDARLLAEAVAFPEVEQP